MHFRHGHDLAIPSPRGSRGCVLVVENDMALLEDIENRLEYLGYVVLSAKSGTEAKALLHSNEVEMVLMESVLPGMAAKDLIKYIKADEFERNAPVMLMVSQAHEDVLLDCMAAGGDDYILKPFSTTYLGVRLSALEQVRELRNIYDGIMHEQVVARRILTAALSARSAVVNDMRVLSKSADVFSGDLVLTARHPDGDLLVLLADFTGHGLSAAIGVLPVADVFSVMSDKGFSPQQILSSINQKLLTLLPTGMFMAACMLKIDKDLNHASIWNGGMPEVFLLDNRLGKIKYRIASRHLPLGIAGSVERSFIMEKLDISAGDHFIMYSDGLTDAVNLAGDMFGTSRLHLLIETSDTNDRVFSSIVNAFEEFCEDQKPMDDITLVNIPCCAGTINPPRRLQDAIHE